MTKQFDLNEALKNAIQTEKDVMDFYQKAAGATKTPRGKAVFETLAREEREHAGHFFDVYPGKDLGTFEEFMARPPQSGIALQKKLETALKERGTEQIAMEIALQEEQDLEKKLLATAAQVQDPAVKAVFEKMAKETNNHYQIIESEYAHIMKMVREDEMNTYVRE